MNETDHSAAGAPTHSLVDENLPLGDHPLEVAARQGFGPLSPLAHDAWHGNATPCVSCGQLVPRSTRRCDHCGQDLAPRMLEKMRAHAGPWFVYEHLRPFPGVSLERIIRQIRRGLLTETSIVRGPATDFQWRFAVETPGLCRYFGKCWSCQSPVSPSDTYCPHCLTYLTFEKPRATTPSAGTGAPRPPTASGVDLGPSPESRMVGGLMVHRSLAAPARAGQRSGSHRTQDLEMLRAALEVAPVSPYESGYEGPPRMFGVNVLACAPRVYDAEHRDVSSRRGARRARA